MAKTKLNQEHINKIESLINISMPHKWVEHTVQISANRQGTITTGANIFTFDQETGLLIIHFELENRQGVFEPLDLTDVRHVILGYQFVGEDGGIIEHEPHIIDVDLGIVAMIMPNQFDWSGTVYVHTFIQYLDGRAFDAGMLQMQWTKSWLDKELPVLSQLEISRFTELIMQIHTLAGVAIGEMQGQLDEFEQGLLQQIGHLQSTMDGLFPIAEDLQNQIDVGGLITGKQFDELREEVSGIATERITGNSSWITVEESREGKLTDKLIEGRTLVNLLSGDRQDWSGSTSINVEGNIITYNNLSINPNSIVSIVLNNMYNFKSNTSYTMIADIEGLFDGIGFTTDGNSNNIFPRSGQNGMEDMLSNGRTIQTMMSREELGAEMTRQSFGIRNFTDEIITITVRVVLSIFEGDLTNLTLNHTLPRQFASVGTGVFPSNLSVTSIGENLFDGELELGSIAESNGVLIPGSGEVRNVNPIPVEGGRRVFQWRQGAMVLHFFQYDAEMNFLSSNMSIGSGALELRPDTRFIRVRTGSGQAGNLNFQATITYDRRVTQPIPHKSTTQSLIFQNEEDEWLPVPKLQGIMNGAELLVADEVTETEYIQRVVEIDINTLVANGNVEQLESSTRLNFDIPFSTIELSYHQAWVTCNKLPSTGAWNEDLVRVTLNSQRSVMRVNIPQNSMITNANQFRQYLVENNYRFIVPLAKPRRYPIRSWDLDSFEQVTHVHVSSGAVSPRTSFKIATSIGQRLSLLTGRLTRLEEEFRNHIQTLAKAIVQPTIKRDYRSVAEIGFPEVFETDSEVDVDEE